MISKPTCGGKRTELLHNMMENRTYIQLKYLASDRETWVKNKEKVCHKRLEIAED